MSDSFVRPLDEHNLRLLALTHPPDWNNPAPAAMYDLVVIGGGTAGLVSAVGAAGLGARVAIVERALLGGDCLHTGCVPSKALLRAARAVREARAARVVGIAMDPHVDFGAVMARLRATRAALATHDSAARLASLGIDVFFGSASFAGRRCVTVDGSTLRFRRAVIATGARPATPDIPGLGTTPYLTSETLFRLTEQPRDLIIVGGGAVGCEMAQAFALLGTRVTLLDAAPRLLSGMDEDAAALVGARLQSDGVRVRTAATIRRVEQAHNRLDVVLEDGTISGDVLLVAAGRTPNIEGLRVEAAGIRADHGRLHVDDRLRTSNARVYAAGDVCSTRQFTHAADAMARLVLRNALFFGRQRVSRLLIPSCVYTVPEIAHVGPDAADRPRQAASVTVSLRELDRAVLDDETDGFVKVWHVRGRIVAGTVVAAHAGEIIGQLAGAIRANAGLGDLSNVVFPYPTMAESLRKAGDAYNRGRVTAGVRRLLAGYFKLMRW